PVTADAGAAITRDRVLVEFSVPEASLEHLRLVARAGGRAVIGTTGFSGAHREEIAALARQAAILVAPSMSVAVTLAFTLLKTMAKVLGDDYDVEITETHHRYKKDAPSGTAVHMAEIVARALGRDLKQVGVYGRQGLPGDRVEVRVERVGSLKNPVVKLWPPVACASRTSASTAITACPPPSRRWASGSRWTRSSRWTSPAPPSRTTSRARWTTARWRAASSRSARRAA